MEKEAPISLLDYSGVVEDLLVHPPGAVRLLRDLHRVRIITRSPGTLDLFIVAAIPMIVGLMEAFSWVLIAKASVILGLLTAPLFVAPLVLFVIRGLRATAGHQVEVVLTDDLLMLPGESIPLRLIRGGRYDTDSGGVLMATGRDEVMVGRMAPEQGRWLLRVLLTASVEALEREGGPGGAEEVPDALRVLLASAQETRA